MSMNDDETQPSGSRWEPTEPTQPTESTQPTQPTQPTAPPAAQPAYAVPAPATKERLGWLPVAGAAAGIALAAGVAGFAIGQATADDGRQGPPARFGTHGDEHGPRGFPEHGQPPPGIPGDDGSDDDGSTTPDDGATQGS
jgi:hypothetical protein